MNNIIRKFKLKKKTANARKWKHKKGGKAFVEGVSILDSNPNAYKYVKKKIRKSLQGGNTGQYVLMGLNALMQGVSTYKLNLYFNKLAESIKTKSEADKAKYRSLMYSDFMKAFDISPTKDNAGNIINKSDIEARNQAYNYASSAEYDDSAVGELLNNIELLKSLAWSDYFLNLAGTATNILGNYVANKALSKNGTPSSMNQTPSNKNYLGGQNNLFSGYLSDPNKFWNL